jgi:hypothetical protein
MAISVAGSATHSGNSTTTFSVALPTTQANDIIILEYTHRATADATIGGTYSGPAFAEKHDQQYATSTFSGKTLWSRASGNHSGQTVTGSGLTNSCAAIVTVYRGCVASGDPLADATIVGEQNASGNETQAQITTATNGAWVVLVVANSPDVAVTSATCTSPGALTNRAEHLSTGGTDTSICHASAEKASAGATGSFTWAQTDGAGGSWAYALVPAASTPYSADLTTPTFTFTANSVTRLNAYSASLSLPDVDFTANSATRLNDYNVEPSTPSFSFTGALVDFGNIYIAELSVAALSFTANTVTTIAHYVGTLTTATFSYTAHAATGLFEYVAELTTAAFAFTANILSYQTGEAVAAMIAYLSTKMKARKMRRR